MLQSSVPASVLRELKRLDRPQTREHFGIRHLSFGPLACKAHDRSVLARKISELISYVNRNPFKLSRSLRQARVDLTLFLSCDRIQAIHTFGRRRKVIRFAMPLGEEIKLELYLTCFSFFSDE